MQQLELGVVVVSRKVTEAAVEAAGVVEVVEHAKSHERLRAVPGGGELGADAVACSCHRVHEPASVTAP